MDTDRLIADNGYKVGIVVATSGAQFEHFHTPLHGKKGEYQIFDLNSSTSAQLAGEGWGSVNPSFICNSNVKWYLKK